LKPGCFLSYGTGFVNGKFAIIQASSGRIDRFGIAIEIDPDLAFDLDVCSSTLAAPPMWTIKESGLCANFS